MPDEDLYPTMRFYTCPDCSQVFTESLTGVNNCPRCRRAMGNRANQPFFTVGEAGEHARVHIQGGSYRIGDLAQLKVALELLNTKRPKSIAFIFDGQSVLDSGFLNLMARTVYLQSQTGNLVFVVSQASHMLESLQILGLDRVVTIVPDENAYQNALLHLGDSKSLGSDSSISSPL